MWDAHAGDMLRYATLLVGPSDADDLVAGAFERATRVERLIVDQRAYLFRTLANLAIDQSRSRKRRQARELRVAVSEPTVVAPEPRADVRRAVAGLSVRQRAVVYFTYWEDLDSNQIAALLEISPSSVRRHLARAGAHLRKALS